MLYKMQYIPYVSFLKGWDHIRIKILISENKIFTNLFCLIKAHNLWVFLFIKSFNGNWLYYSMKGSKLYYIFKIN